MSSKYTGKNFPSLSASKARRATAVKAKLEQTASNALNLLEGEAAMAYPATNNEPLTLEDFKHAYVFIISTQGGLTPKQMDTFLDSYYSHIRTDCMKYILAVTNPDTYVPEPADQAEVESDAIKRVDAYLAGKGEHLKEQAK